MLTVEVKFIANELTPGLQNGKYQIEEGASFRDLIAVCEAQCGASVPPNNFAFMNPLFNGKPITIDSTFTENGTLHLCRIILGG